MRLWRVAVRALAAVMMICSVGAAGAAEPPIRIGAFLSVTGVMSPMGDPERRALDLAVDQANAAGGLLGRPIELVAFDDASDPEKAVGFVKRLIEHERVDLLIGGSGTPTSVAVLGLVERAQIPYISLGGGTAIIDPVRRWTFKIPQTDKMAAERVLADLRARGLTRIGLLSESAGFGKSGHDHTVALAPSYGIEVAADEVYSPKDPDVTPQLTRIRAVPGIQALFVFGTGTGPAVATRNVRQLGLTQPLYQSHGVSTREFLRLVGPAAEGMRLPAGAQTVAERLADDDPQKPVVLAFKRAFEARNPGMEATLQAGHGLDAFEIAAQAIRRVGGTDKARVRDEIERTTRHVGSTGVYTYTAGDHLGLGPDAFHMVEVRDGAWVPVD